jgi:MarR family transcriptional regulator for hemolysin
MFRIAHLSRRWRQVLDVEAQAAGLTDATWRPLLHLFHLGDGVRQKDLAASLGIEGPSLVRLLDSLAAKGLIARTEDDADRRAKRLSLTPEGREVGVRIREMVASLEDTILSQFSDEEIDRVAAFIQKLEFSVNSLRRREKR